MCVLGAQRGKEDLVAQWVLTGPRGRPRHVEHLAHTPDISEGFLKKEWQILISRSLNSLNSDVRDRNLR